MESLRIHPDNLLDNLEGRLSNGTRAGKAIASPSPSRSPTRSRDPQPDLFSDRKPHLPVPPPPARSASRDRAPYSPVGTFVRDLRSHTAEALSRLPSAPSSAALPRVPLLGQTTHREPLTEPARALRERVRAAGLAGYRLREHDREELLASYDLYRRGDLIALGDWTYRLARAS